MVSQRIRYLSFWEELLVVVVEEELPAAEGEEVGDKGEAMMVPLKEGQVR